MQRIDKADDKEEAMTAEEAISEGNAGTEVIATAGEGANNPPEANEGTVTAIDLDEEDSDCQCSENSY